MDYVAFGAIILSLVALAYTHVQTKTSRDSRRDEIRAQRSALIRVHRFRGEGGDQSLIVANVGQADCMDAEVELIGDLDGGLAWIGVESGSLVASGLRVPAGSWISLPVTVGRTVDIMAALIEVRWSDGEGKHSTVQTLGSALRISRLEPSFWAQSRTSGI